MSLSEEKGVIGGHRIHESVHFLSVLRNNSVVLIGLDSQFTKSFGDSGVQQRFFVFGQVDAALLVDQRTIALELPWGEPRRFMDNGLFRQHHILGGLSPANFIHCFP